MKVKIGQNLTGLATLFVSLLVSSNAYSHGYMVNPKARQAICVDQGGYWWPADGTGIPNLACRAAFLDDGDTPFTQANEFSINVTNFNSQTAVEAAIPAGTLCAGGSTQKDGIDIPSPDWQTTTVTPNSAGQITVEFFATAPHDPSFWRFYLTNSGFNPATDNVTWNNISLIDSKGNVPTTLSSDGRRFYIMDIDMPVNRTGRAVLFTRWQRDDAAGEGFYNCSDIIIGDDVNPPTWVSVGFYWNQANQANVGDTVRTRLFDASGSELFDESLLITTGNVANWQTLLATTLNQNYPGVVRIGVEQNNGDIVFNSGNLVQNRVYALSSAYSYNLSVSQGGVNNPPTVAPISNQTVSAGSSVTVSASATDPDGDALSYSWSVPVPLTVSGSAAQVTINAPAGSASATLAASVTVSDGSLTTTENFNVTIGTSSGNTWDANAVYLGGDEANYNGVNYRAKWWTRGDIPGSGILPNGGPNPWEAL